MRVLGRHWWRSDYLRPLAGCGVQPHIEKHMKDQRNWFKEWDRYIKRDKKLKRLLLKEYNFRRREKSVESFDDYMFETLQEVIDVKDEARKDGYMFPSLKRSLGSIHRILELFIILTVNDLFEDGVTILYLSDNNGNEWFMNLNQYDDIPLEDIEFMFPDGFNIKW